MTVTLSSTGDGSGSGLRGIYYTTDGTTPTTSSPLYAAPVSLTVTATVKFFAGDNVGNTETVHSQLITITGGGGGGGSAGLVQQKQAFGSAASLPVTLNSASGAGHALVAVVALAAGSSASVNTVTDSAGPSGSWLKGPIGFLGGANSRLEIWYRLNAPSVSSVTVTLSASKALAVSVSEWSGVTALDKSAGGSGASGTTITTPSLATTNANDLLIAATNYPASTTSTLTAASFAGLNNFDSGSAVHGRAAYRIATATGSYLSSWSLNTASGGHGTAILALKVDANAFDTTPPSLSLSLTGDATDFVSGSTVFDKQSVSGGFSATATATDPESSVSVQFPVVFGGDGATISSPPFTKSYIASSAASGTKTVTATSSGGSSTAQFSITQDTAAPTTSMLCNPVSCTGSWVTVTLSADDGSGSGTKTIYYTTDGQDPTTSSAVYDLPITVWPPTTVKFFAVDNVGNQETFHSQDLTATDTTAPTTPVLTLTTPDSTDFVDNTTKSVFYNPSGSNTGGFTVAAATSDPESPVSVQFPDVFAGGDGGSAQSPGPSFSQTYSWTSGNSSPLPGTLVVAASSAGGGPANASFTVTPDVAPPTTSMLCNPVSCTGSPVTVTLSADDGSGSGKKQIHYTTNGVDPTTSSPVYAGPFLLSTTATVKFFAVDNVGNTETIKSQLVTITTPPPPTIALVQQKPAFGSAASLPVTLNSVSGAGHALVAVVALAAGSSASVSTVTDSAGPSGSWVKGPIGFLTGTNSRVEIWYRLNAPSVSSVTVTLSASKALAVSVSEGPGSDRAGQVRWRQQRVRHDDHDAVARHDERKRPADRCDQLPGVRHLHAHRGVVHRSVRLQLRVGRAWARRLPGHLLQRAASSPPGRSPSPAADTAPPSSPSSSRYPSRKPLTIAVATPEAVRWLSTRALSASWVQKGRKVWSASARRPELKRRGGP